MSNQLEDAPRGEHEQYKGHVGPDDLGRDVVSRTDAAAEERFGGEERLLEHEYDGIREYDNPTPGWWHAIFAASIVFSIFYVVFWHTSPMAPSVIEQHDAAKARELRRQFAGLGELTPDEATLVRLMHDERWLPVAEGIFRANCSSCHRSEGQGLVGPNLTDEYWKNVAAITDIPRVISEGAAKGAMPAQKNRLHPNEIVLVSAYVAALRGTNVPGGKSPEGDQIEPWPDLPEG